ncbi:DinB family protein [Bacillus paramycoides]|uniref:DinB family protein n=1 Tax=Bacillus paramycoides TaxID=2026194 RepID=UPI003D00564C
MKDLHLEKDMNSQVAILYATVRDTFKRLQNLVEGTEEKELSFKGSENNENNIGQLLQHLAVVDLHWVYRLKGEEVPQLLENKYGPMLNEIGKLPSLRKHTLQELMQDYEEVQHLFYEECMKLTEDDLTREVYYEKGESATIRWGIWHIADHNRYHQAHISRLRKLYKEYQLHIV